MLNKRHNSVITLTILLSLVGLSKPAKAFLLAQADAPEVTFTVPEKLSKNAKVRIAASNSTGAVNEGLKESFAAKYPNAKVDVTTASSDDAIKELLSGNTDLAAIGRNLTAEEKSQGLVAVPISREKIAIVVSKDSSYDGNLTFSQFAQIFRGEITDWSEVGGEPGAINLIDMPSTNDTRRSFPNYSVFQEGEFAASPNANQIDEDSTDAMVAQLGENGIGYAVAGDAIDRDDVKIVTMHQTQPDDARYPFSQPFSLVYQGEPKAATEAFLGYAVTDEGQQTIAQRVGSISAVSAAAIATNIANKPASTANPQENGNIAQADLDDSGQTNPDVEGSGKTNADLDDSGQTNPDVEGSGELDSDVDGSAEVKPEFQDSGKVNSDVEDSGKPNSEANTENEPKDEANLEIDDVEAVTPDAKGEEAKTAKADVDGDGNAQLDADTDVDTPPAVDGDGNAQLDADADVDTPPAVDGDGNAQLDADGNADADAEVVPAEGEGNATVAEKESNFPLWWIPLVIGIPILGAIAYKFAGGKKKSDREPALANVPNADAPQGRVDGTFDPDLDGGDSTRIGAGVGSNSASVETGTIGGTAIASGTAMAGGAAAARNLSKGADINKSVKPIELENVVAEPETNIDTPIEEIPANSVNEFTSQDTSLQSSEQPTKLQADSVIDDEADSPGLLGNLSAMGGIAAAGGAAAAASGYLGNRQNSDDVAETSDTSFNEDTYVNDDSEVSTTSPTETVDYGNRVDVTNDNLNTGATATEFAGDYVLYEEGAETQVDNVDSTDRNLTTDNDNWVNSDTTAESFTIDTDTPSADLDADTAINEGRGGIGGAAAAASGFFTNSDSQSTEIDSIDADITDDDDNWVDSDTASSNISTDNIVVETSDTQTTDLVDGDRWVNSDTTAESFTIDTDTPSADLDADTAINEGRGGIGGAAAAASGFFTNSDSQSTEIDSIDADITDDDDNWVDSDTASSDISTDNIVVETSDTQTTDLVDDDRWVNSDTTAESFTIDTDTSSADLDADTAIDEGRGGIGGAAMAGGAAAIGGAAAAASGFFTNSDSQSTEIDSIDADITDDDDNWVDSDTASSDISTDNIVVETSDTQTTDLVDGDRWVNSDTTADSFTIDTDTPSADLDADTAIDEGRGGIGGAAAAASGFFTNSDSQSTEIDSIDADITDDDDNWVDSDTASSDISTDNIVVETSDTQTTDLVDGDRWVNSDTTADSFTIDTDTPSADLDADTAIDEGRGGIGGAAAAASGFFTNSDSQPTEIDSIDADISDDDDNWVDSDTASSDISTDNIVVETSDTQTTDLVDDDRWVNSDTTAESFTIDTDTPSADLDADTAINEGRGGIGGAAMAGGAAAIGGAAAAASGFFTNSDSQSTEIDSIDADITDDDDITSDSSNVNVSLEEITFDDATDSGEVNLENITFDDSNASLEDITFDDSNASLENITFDDDTEVDLEDITFDDSNSNVNLEDITFDDNIDSTEVSLENITFDDADSDNSIDDLIDSINADPSDTSSKQEVDLDELGFETQKNDANADLLSNKTAEISGLSDEQSNDMNNISEWLDSLETPNQNTDNISEWLDNLSADTDGINQSKASKKQAGSKEGSEDISFQFLEDLLEREDEGNK